LPEPAAIENAVRRALTDLGDAASGPEVAAHVERVYGIHIDPKFLPVYRVSILGRQRLERERAERRTTTGSRPRTLCGIREFQTRPVRTAEAR
jgi:hypothetical protein